jgi:hypothetical protein
MFMPIPKIALQHRRVLYGSLNFPASSVRAHLTVPSPIRTSDAEPSLRPRSVWIGKEQKRNETGPDGVDPAVSDVPPDSPFLL